MIPGQIVLTLLSPMRGREQGGRRPAVVLSSLSHIRVVDSLLIVAPCTTTYRDWPNHIRLTGATELLEPTFAMTEQPRTIARTRIVTASGYVDNECLSEIAAWARQWIVDPAIEG